MGRELYASKTTPMTECMTCTGKNHKRIYADDNRKYALGAMHTPGCIHSTVMTDRVSESFLELPDHGGGRGSLIGPGDTRIA